MNSAKTSEPATRPAISAVVVGLSLIAFAVSSYLAWHSLSQGNLIGCGEANEFSCDQVLGSRWSKVLGLPVAVGGAASYLVLLLAAVWRWSGSGTVQRWGSSLTIFAAFTAAAAAVWFTLLQLFVVGKLCWYCMGVHCCGLTVACLLVWEYGQRRPTGPAAITIGTPAIAPDRARSPAPFWRCAALGMAVVVGLAGVQIFFPTAGHEVTQLNSDALIGVSGFGNDMASGDDAADRAVRDAAQGPSSLADSADDGVSDADASAEPRATTNAEQADEPAAVAPKKNRFDQAFLIGNRAAPHAIVEVIDYTCGHCREIYPTLERMIAKYPDQLAILVVPIATDSSCNQYVHRASRRNERSCKFARLAIALWQIDPEAFMKFHRWILEDESHESLSQAWSFANRLVGTQAVLDAIDHPQVAERLAANNEVWNKLGRELPTLVVGGQVIRGMVESDAKLAELIESYLPFNPAGSE